jgi:putative phage-type endonuclease
LKQGTPEWHAARAGKLTGSMFAAALGLSPYCSRQKLWRLLTGREQPDPENDAMRRGTECEPIAIDWYECETGNLVIPVGFVPHPHFDWCGVSPDGLSGNGRIEVKCPVNGAHSGIPGHYLPQCVGVLHITGGEWLDFVSWHPEGSLIHRISAEETGRQWYEWEDMLSVFWNEYVLADREPPRKRRK